MTPDTEFKDANPVPQSVSGQALANGWERFGAFVIDSVSVLLPLALLAVAPLKRLWIMGLHTDDPFSQNSLISLMVVVAVGVVLAYHTFMLRYFSATLGKMFFGLRVVDVWSHKQLSFSQSFQRSLFWLVGLLLVFLPHLAVLYNRKRRPLHDRLADSIVLSKLSREEGRPNFLEVSFGHSVLALIWALVAVLLTYELVDIYRSVTDPSRIAKSREEEGSLCKSVGEAIDEWTTERRMRQSRLDVAMAMYAAGSLSDECLDGEAQLVFRTEGPTAAAYLAKSFVESEDEEISDFYLREVCKQEEGSTACEFSKLLQAWSRGEKDDFLLGLKSLAHTDSIYIKIWTIRHFISHDMFGSAREHLQSLEPHPSMAGFLGMARARTLWGQNEMAAASVVAKTLYESMPPSDRRELASWMCFSGLNRDCSYSKSEDCTIMAKELRKLDDIADSRAGLALVRQYNCKKETLASEWKQKLSDPRILRLSALVDKRALDGSPQALVGVKEISIEPEVPSDIRAAAIGFWFDWEGPRAELKKIIRAWQDLDKNLAWFDLGKKLLLRASKEGAHEEVAFVGTQLETFGDVGSEVKLLISKAKQSIGVRIPASRKASGP